MTGNKLNFTKQAIEALPIPEQGKRNEYQDAKIHGLTLRVTASGVKTFCLRRKLPNGTSMRLTLGQFPQLPIDQARILAQRALTEVLDGIDPAQKRREAKTELTFDGLFENYIERHAKPRKRTWQEDVSKYDLHIKSSIGSKRLSKVTRVDVALIHDALTRSGKPTTANRVLALLLSVFNWGISVGLTEINPATNIRRNIEKSRDRFLSADELPRFFKALAEEPNDTIRDYFLLSLLTGARRSNVLAMRWDEISIGERLWKIPLTKNGTPQTVPLVPEAVAILRRRRESTGNSPFVFPGDGQSGHLVEPKKGWTRILERAEIDNLRIHDLRRSLGSWQAATGASLSIIGKSLNHKNMASTAVYARLDIDPVRASMEKAVEAMFQASRCPSRKVG